MPRSPKQFHCLVCDKDFMTVNYKKDLIPKCCSKECRIKLQTKHEIVSKKCPVCNVDFLTSEAETCSIQCGNIWKNRNNNKDVVCCYCEKVFNVPSSRKIIDNIFCSRECFDNYNLENKWGKSNCEYCNKEIKFLLSKPKRFCSPECSWRDEEKKQETILRNKLLYTGVPLKERGFTEEKLQEHIQRNVERNKLGIGKTFEEKYGEEKSKEIKSLMSENKSGDKNNMSLKTIADRYNVSLEEASNLTPAKGRVGKLHPMFGKHHAIESKIKMMETFEKRNSHYLYFFSNGYFDNIKWQGTWELKFLIDCIEKNIPIKRFDLTPIEYFDEKNIIHHYFPDFIINEDEVVEIKGNENRENTFIKKIAAEKIFGEKYIYINSIIIGASAKNFLRMAKEKYNDRIIITRNPHEKEN